MYEQDTNTREVTGPPNVPGPQSLVGILKGLKGDHGQMSAMMQRISATGDAGKRAALFHEFRAHLLAHAEAEEATFYTALSRHSRAEPLASRGAREHQLALDTLRDLDTLEPASTDWSDRFIVLQRCVLQHVEQEESRLFEQAKQLFDVRHLEQLERQFWVLKRRALATHL